MLLPAEFEPQRDLKPFVKCYWTITGNGSDSDDGSKSRQPKQFLADAGIKLSFNFASSVEFVLHDGRKLQASKGTVCGALTKNYWTDLSGEINSFGVQFHPGGAYPFVPFSMDTLTDTFCDMEQIVGINGRRLVETMQQKDSTTSRRIELMEGFLLERLKQFKNRDNVFEQAIHVIWAQQGRVDLADLCRRLGLSQRQLERKFHQKSGMTPKRLCRILRFRHLFEYISAHPDIRWIDIALICGFCDQAHLIRDFKHFTGMSPGTFIKEIVNQDRLVNWGYNMEALARFGLGVHA